MKERSFYTTKEAAKYLGVSTSTVYRMEKRGLVCSIKTPGEQRCFSKKNIEKYLKKGKNLKAHKNPIRYKKTDFIIKDREFSYSVENAKFNVSPQDELFFHSKSVWIYNADVLKINSIKEQSIDLIVTSPPYNVDIKYNSHNDALSYNDYLLFTREWLSRCYKFLKDDGRFCLNIPLDKNKGGQQSVYADITNIAKQVGFKYHSTIIWNEQNISRRTAWG